MIIARAVLAGWTLACGWAAAPVYADVRVASAAAREPETQRSSPTHPVLRDAQVRLDTDAGRVDVTVNFHQPLADPVTTSALRRWVIRVQLGDWVRPGSCEGDNGTSVWLDAALGSYAPGVLGRLIDGEPRTPVTKSFSTDRSSVTLSAMVPALVGLNLICGQVDVSDLNYQDPSSTLAFLFDGYSLADGGFQREAAAELDDNVNALDAFWFDRRPGSFEPPGSSCQTPIGETVSCRVLAARLPDVPGRPNITLHGVLKLDTTRLLRSTAEDAMPWRYDLRGRINWRRCPQSRQDHTPQPPRASLSSQRALEGRGRVVDCGGAAQDPRSRRMTALAERRRSNAGAVEGRDPLRRLLNACRRSR